MAAIKYKVELTEAERSRLNDRGKVRTVKRALSLLKADQGCRASHAVLNSVSAHPVKVAVAAQS